MAKDQEIKASIRDFAKAFTEWERRYRETPEEYMSEVNRLLKETPYSYGESCSVYFFNLLKETR